MNPVVTIRGPVEPDLLRRWLDDLAPRSEIRAGGDATTVGGLGLDLRLDTATAPDVDPTWWAASAVRRAARTVADADTCTSPGLEDVLVDGSWTHPRAHEGRTTPAGVMLVKPGMRARPAALRDIGRRLAECGYRAERAVVVTASEIEHDDLAVRHHGAHSELALRGRMSPSERIAYLTTYDTPAFAARFGTTAGEIDIFPAQAVVDELGVPVETLRAWSSRDTARHNLDSGAVDGPNNIGDCLFVNVFQDPDHHGGRPFAVLNPHMPGVLAEFQGGSGAIAVQIDAVSDHALPWPRMRKEFCGATDPRAALPGSIRGDALAGLLDLSREDGRPVQRTNNGVHLSNGAVEALRDGWTWLRLRPDETDAGRTLAAAGVSPWDAVTKPFVVVDGIRRVAQELTDGLDARRAAELLSGGRLVAHADGREDRDVVRLVDESWERTSALRHSPATLALVLAVPPGGRAALVVVEDSASAGRATRLESGHPHTVIRCSTVDAPRTLASLTGGGTSTAVLLPLWDPQHALPGLIRPAAGRQAGRGPSTSPAA
ncbi:MAG: hypothetical protein ABWY11_24145 [Umezawaea sp.]